MLQTDPLSYTIIMFKTGARKAFLYEIWGSHGSEDVDVGLLVCNVVWTCRLIPAFRRNILPPSPLPKMVSTYKSTRRYNPENNMDIPGTYSVKDMQKHIHERKTATNKQWYVVKHCSRLSIGLYRTDSLITLYTEGTRDKGQGTRCNVLQCQPLVICIILIIIIIIIISTIITCISMKEWKISRN
jgi:hypothetical protein